MLLERAAELEVALEAGDADAEITMADDGSACAIVERAGRIVYAESGLDDDMTNLTARFLAVLIGGGAL